jgi:hypothetical protein
MIGTVKEQSEFRGEKQTVIFQARKVEEMAAKEIAA